MIETQIPQNKKQPSLFTLTQRLCDLYRPYFGMQGKKFWRSAAFVTMLTFNILSALTGILINSTMDTFLGVLGLPNAVTYAAYFSALGYFVGAILIACTLNFIATAAASWLAESLSFTLNKKFAKNWLSSKAYYGVEFMTSKKSALDPAQIMSHDNPELSNDAIEIINTLIMVTGNCLVGLYGLYILSVPLTFTIMTTTITIPAFMMLSTLVYAVGYNFITSRAGASLSAKLKIIKKNDADYDHQIAHVNNHAEEIAFKEGANFESLSLLEILQRNRVAQKAIIRIRSTLAIFNQFHMECSQFVSYILASPSIISGNMNLSAMFQISGHFQNVVRFFTFRSENFDKIERCNVNLEKIEKLQAELANWNQFQTENPSTLKFMPFNTAENENIYIRNFSINIPEKETPILQNFNARIRRGAFNLIEAPSGTGKTTALRAIAGLNPLTEGEIIGLPQKRHFIPSLPYFPYGKTLAQAILYPSKTPATQAQLQKMRRLMEEFRLEPSKIDLLEKVQDWYSGIFSDGQRKRIMIIAAIMAEPEVLFMDEPTRGLGEADQDLAYAKLREYLPNTTMIETNHNPSPNMEYERIQLR